MELVTIHGKRQETIRGAAKVIHSVEQDTVSEHLKNSLHMQVTRPNCL